MNTINHNKGGIYMIKNLINGKCYIGSAKRLRKRNIQHIWDADNNKHHCEYFQKSWHKYGGDNFYFVVLELVSDFNNLLVREQFYIDLFQPAYNICPTAGSALGRVPSAQHRERLRQANLGKKHSQERRDRNRMSSLKFVEEHPEMREIARINATGKKQSQEAKNKQSETMKRIRAQFPEKYPIEKHGNYGKGMPVIQLDLNGLFIQQYISAYQAQLKLGISESSIKYACNAKKSYRGYFWKFA